MRKELEGLPEPNWFWHGENILQLLDRYRPVNCVELGTNRGCSAIATARLIQQWDGRLTCVDQWIPDGHNLVTLEEFRANAGELSKTIRTIKGKTEEVAKEWEEEIDYLYIDADHTFEACTQDLELWWPFLKVGGLIAGDDYDDPFDTEVPKRVTRAWDTFELKHFQTFVRTTTPGLESRLIWGIKR